MDEKGPEQSNNNIVLKLDLNTALKVGRIIDDLINTLDYQHKSEIAVSDILSSIYIVPVGFLIVKPKVNKNQNLGPVSLLIYLLSDGYPIQKLEIPNLKFEIPN